MAKLYQMCIKKQKSECTRVCTSDLPSTTFRSGIEILKRPQNNSQLIQPNFYDTNTGEMQQPPIRKSDVPIKNQANEAVPRLGPLKPLHVRIMEYNLARERIFKETHKKSRSAVRLKSYWGKIKKPKEEDSLFHSRPSIRHSTLCQGIFI